MKSDKRPRAGLLFLASPRFLALGEDTARGTYRERKEAYAKSFIEKLEGIVDITYEGMIFERDRVNESIRRFVNEKVDFVIACFLSWSEDFAWIRFLRDMPDIPVLLINPVKMTVGFENTLSEDDFTEFLSSGGLVGSLEASGSIRRLSGRVKVLVGPEEEILEEIKAFSGAARVKSRLKKAGFGLLANYNELMWSTYVDPYNFFASVGPELHFISYNTFADEINAVSDEEADKYMKELKENYSVTKDVDPSKFLESARASLGMYNLAEKLDIDALILNDVDSALFKLIGLRPGFYHPRFNERQSVVVPEGDVGGGLITYCLRLMTGKHVNFIEPFYIEGSSGCFAGGHAGPNDHTDPEFKGNVKIARDVRFAKTAYRFAGAPFAWYRIPPGRKTMAHISECNGRYKLVCTLVDSLPGEHFITSYSHSMFRPLVPVKELFRRILEIGTTQHFAVVDGDLTKELGYFASIMNFEYHNLK